MEADLRLSETLCTPDIRPRDINYLSFVAVNGVRIPLFTYFKSQTFVGYKKDQSSLQFSAIVCDTAGD